MLLGKKRLQKSCIILSLLFISCVEDPTPTESRRRSVANPGDIILVNDTMDAVHLLDSNGVYKKLVYNHLNTEAAFGGNYHDGKIIYTVDTGDRVEAYDIESGRRETIIINSNLTGTLRGLTGLVGGDYLVIETNAIERFNANYERITSNGWPKTLMTTPNQINPLANGGFVLCATGTDAVRTYDEDGNQVATVNSPAAGATNPYGCVELEDGRIAAVWEGTQDRVVIYSSDLTTVELSFNDIGVISNPRSIAQAANGNLLIADYDRDQIVEMTQSGTFVRTFGDGHINNPSMIAVVPDN